MMAVAAFAALVALPWAVRAFSGATRSPNGVPLPSPMHVVLAAPPRAARTIVVGDVHGCFDELCDLLAKLNYREGEDVLVLVGDLVNKGPKSVQVVRWARERQVPCVRGNHDDALLSVLRRTGKWADSAPPPSYDYARDLSPEDVAYLEGLPYSLSLPWLNVLVVHAGIVPGRPLSEQRPLDLFKMRNVRPAAEGGGLEGLEKGAEGAEPWAKVYGGELGHIVFGHDAKRGLQREVHATGLDSGCCYGKQLSALVLPAHEIVSTDARAMYEVPGSAKRQQAQAAVASSEAESGSKAAAGSTANRAERAAG